MRLRSADDNASEDQDVAAEAEDIVDEGNWVWELCCWVFRRSLATLLAYIVHEFFFSSGWLHGYVWAMNQNYARSDLIQISGGLMDRHHRILLPISFHIMLLFLSVIVQEKFLRWARGVAPWSLWALCRMSFWIAVLCMALRNVQEQHRLFPSLHEGTYIFIHAQVVAFTLTLRLGASADKAKKEA